MVRYIKKKVDHSTDSLRKDAEPEKNSKPDDNPSTSNKNPPIPKDKDLQKRIAAIRELLKEKQGLEQELNSISQKRTVLNDELSHLEDKIKELNVWLEEEQQRTNPPEETKPDVDQPESAPSEYSEFQQTDKLAKIPTPQDLMHREQDEPSFKKIAQHQLELIKHFLLTHNKVIILTVLCLCVVFALYTLLKPAHYEARVKINVNPEAVAKSTALLKNTETIKLVLAQNMELPTNIEDREKALNNLVAKYGEEIQVVPNAQDGQINVHVGAEDPQKAAQMARDLVHLNNMDVNQQYREDYIEEKVSEMDTKIEGIERLIEEERKKIVNHDEQEVFNNISDDLKNQLQNFSDQQRQSVSEEIEDLTEQRDSLDEKIINKADQQSRNFYMSDSFFNEPSIVEYRRKLAKLIFESYIIQNTKGQSSAEFLANEKQIKALKSTSRALVKKLFKEEVTLEAEVYIALIIKQLFLESKIMALNLLLNVPKSQAIDNSQRKASGEKLSKLQQEHYKILQEKENIGTKEVAPVAHQTVSVEPAVRDLVQPYLNKRNYIFILGIIILLIGILVYKRSVKH